MKNSVLVVVLVLESGEIAASAVFKMYSYLRVPGVALQPWVRDLGGKETVLVGWWRGLLKEPWIGSSAEGEAGLKILKEQGKGSEYRSGDESTAELFSPHPSTCLTSQKDVVGMNWASHCYCPVLSENRDGRDVKGLSETTRNTKSHTK